MARAKREVSLRHTIKKPMSFLKRYIQMHELATAPDQTVALIFGAYVERGLENAIASRLRAMSPEEKIGLFDNGPLSSLMAKIKIGRALALYGPGTVKEINYLREIRNVFAHASHPVTFRSVRIKEKCLRLKIPESNYIESIFPSQVNEFKKDPKNRYIISTFILCLMFFSSKAKRPKFLRDLYSMRYLR